MAFPYKFSRTVNMKCVVVGVKQEKILKLKQCLEESDEGQGAVYLVCEETSMKNAEQQEPSLPSTSNDDERIPPAKKNEGFSSAHTDGHVFTKSFVSIIGALLCGQSEESQDF